jgi:hypothetical protein
VLHRQQPEWLAEHYEIIREINKETRVQNNSLDNKPKPVHSEETIDNDGFHGRILP